MTKPILLHSAAELLATILTGTLPADSQMDKYFRAHPKMGGRDRGFVAETVYGCLREKRVLEHIAGESNAADALVAAWLLAHGYSARTLEDAGFADRTEARAAGHGKPGCGFHGDARVLAERTRQLDKAALPFDVRANLPEWLAAKFLAQFGEAEATELAAALNQAAPVDLRVNALKAKREEVQAWLAEEGFACELTPFSPVGLRRHDRASLFSTRSFKEGLFEIQDEGSQLLSFLLEPKRHEMVVDFCAGAGGKTLHLGALMANTGTLYAFDVSSHRLERLKPRLARAGLGNVRTVAIRHERDDRVRRLQGKIDRVLVDAPCSGTGTLRRNPDIKWRAIDLAELAAMQKNILAAAAALLKPGGRLVYATCSLLREENDDVVADFLALNAGFRILPAGEILARRHIILPGDTRASASFGANDPEGAGGDLLQRSALRLFPHRHGTDGFYAVALERLP